MGTCASDQATPQKSRETQLTDGPQSPMPMPPEYNSLKLEVEKLKEENKLLEQKNKEIDKESQKIIEQMAKSETERKQMKENTNISLDAARQEAGNDSLLQSKIDKKEQEIRKFYEEELHKKIEEINNLRSELDTIATKNPSRIPSSSESEGEIDVVAGAIAPPVYSTPPPPHNPRIQIASNTNTVILTPEECEWLVEQLPLTTQKVNLLYRGSLDGFSFEVQMEMLEKQGPTLILCRAKNGYIFGGFTTVSYEYKTVEDRDVRDEWAFLFSVTRRVVLRSEPSNEQCSHVRKYYDSEFREFPMFKQGFYLKADTGFIGLYDLGGCFQLPQGTKKKGSKEFLTRGSQGTNSLQEMEVFQVYGV